ncbi:hypothetical protein D3C78_1150810 [compost metagenome]
MRKKGMCCACVTNASCAFSEPINSLMSRNPNSRRYFDRYPIRRTLARLSPFHVVTRLCMLASNTVMRFQ